MLRSRKLLLLVPLIALFVTTQAKAVSQVVDCDAAQQIAWQETDTNSFSILYPSNYEPIRQVLTRGQNNGELDRTYDQFAALFDTAVPVPVTIRIYPDAQSFNCLNSQSDEILPGLVHTSSGSREIALMGDAILSDFSTWAANDINLIRYDLGILFAQQAGGDQVPPGLLTGIGHYVQDPSLTIGMLHLNWADWQTPTRDWRALWAEDLTYRDLGSQLQTTSTVAYLVDTYGWDPFLSFLKALPSTQGFSDSLTQSYAVDFADLEAGWAAFYPRYFQSRWQYHPIYNYDLDSYRYLLQAENYREADVQLQVAIAFLQKTQTVEKLNEAQTLLLKAKKGQQAEVLFAQSQVAFQAGQYTESLVLLAQADDAYKQTGNRFFHQDEFAAYQQQVIQTLVLHSEIDQLQARVGTHWNTFSLASEAVSLGRRLGALGDLTGYNQVSELARVVEDRQQQQYVYLSGIVSVIVLLLIVNVIRLARRKPPPEAQL